MRCLVTGVAGFVGSHIAERLLELGHEVVGVDRFTDYYPRPLKERNLTLLRDNARFRLVEADLALTPLDPLLEGCETVYHQAAQAGVRASWGETFATYLHDNVESTQRLLEAVRTGHPGVKKFIYASSSSVYGETPDLPMRETSLTRPYSPYGVTKLSAEHLCELYRHNFGVPTVSLRYFTVYGPRQRPDMAFRKFFALLLAGQSVPLYGDGEQTRDFTFIADIVQANILSMTKQDALGVFNIGGGSRVTMNHVLATMGEIAGRPAVNQEGKQAGDVRHTWADTTRAQEILGYSPTVSLHEGLSRQFQWQREVDGPSAPKTA
jgi:nucleoside-diphosphate-sugar epimerase